MSRQRKRRSNRPAGPPVRETAADQSEPMWVDVGVRRMFVVGWTSGGVPYCVFEGEMDAEMNDIGAVGCDEPF